MPGIKIITNKRPFKTFHGILALAYLFDDVFKSPRYNDENQEISRCFLSLTLCDVIFVKGTRKLRCNKDFINLHDRSDLTFLSVSVFMRTTYSNRI